MLIAQTRPARPSRSGATSHASVICRGGSALAEEDGRERAGREENRAD